MPGSIKRRTFLKTASVISVGMIACPSVSRAIVTGVTDGEMSNGFFTVKFDKKTGRFSVYKPNNEVFIKNATTRINGVNAMYTLSSNQFKHKIQSTRFNDALGMGLVMTIRSRDVNKGLDMETKISLYDGLKAFTVEVIGSNASRHDVVINSAEPLRLVQQESGNVTMPGVLKCLTNGEMYYDAGTIHEFDKDKVVSLEKIKGVSLANRSVTSAHGTIHSWWNAGLFSGYENEGISLGYLSNDLCLGNILIGKTGNDKLSFLAESVYAPKLTLKPGKSISSNRFMVLIANDPYLALEEYASAVGRFQKAGANSIINGWCSWFYTLSQVSEKEVMMNVEFAANYLKGYGIEYIQVDEGFQRLHGDWEGNERFPNGMKWLADSIREKGFRPGIWISPYVISEGTEVYKNHPDWLAKRKDGSLQRIGNWSEGVEPPADENPKRYCLDITHPGGAKWLHDLVNTIANEWGYEMIKIDFVAWSILAVEKYHDETTSAAEVYRKGMAIMRNAAGSRCHILECGPGNTTVGLVDSMRIEADVYYGYREAAWDTYFLHEASSASAAAKRYYFHKRTWVNDADHLCMHQLNNEQSEAAATIIALSGGNMMSGDRLSHLDPYKIQILKKVTPSFGEAAKPVDLFDDKMQSVFALKVKKPFAEWTVAGFFNANLGKAIEKKFSMKRLWLDPGMSYLIYDFWKNEFIGEVKGEMKVSIEPGSVTLLSIHEKTGRPQVISTDRHVVQGGIELENVEWNEAAGKLSGRSMGPLNSFHNVYVYIPGEHPWTWGGSALFRDYEGYSLKLVHNNIIQVHVDFSRKADVDWEIVAKQF